MQLVSTLYARATLPGRPPLQYHPGSVYLNMGWHAGGNTTWQGLPSETIQAIQIDLDDDLLQQEAAAAGLHFNNLHLPPGLCLDTPLLRQLSFSLAATLQAPGPIDSWYIDTVAQMLAAQLVHQYGEAQRPLSARVGGLAPDRLRMVQEYVRASLGQPITLASLAAIACVSPHYFCRLFRRATGLSPNQYVTGQRISRAKYLLQHSD